MDKRCIRDRSFSLTYAHHTCAYVVDEWARDTNTYTPVVGWWVGGYVGHHALFI